MSDPVAGLLAQGLNEGLYSGAAYVAGTPDGPRMRGVLGRTRVDGLEVTDGTWWDLASVTKPIVALALMAAVERGRLLLDDPLGLHVPERRHTPLGDTTVRQLLTHTSGLPGQLPMYHWCPNAEKLWEALWALGFVVAPGQEVIYSSQGFMLLGRVLEAASGRSLDQLVNEAVLAPLGMGHTRWGLPDGLRREAAATEDCPWRGVVVQGAVHDENAGVLGGVCGHAGLFSTLADMERLAQWLVRAASHRSWGGGASSDAEGPPSVAAVAAMIRPATDHLNLRRSLGWQGVDTTASPAGDLMGPRAFGHTGFVGTSLWVDPDLGVYTVLLTNRVYPTREDRGFFRLRRQVLNAMVAAAT